MYVCSKNFYTMYNSNLVLEDCPESIAHEYAQSLTLSTIRSLIEKKQRNKQNYANLLSLFCSLIGLLGKCTKLN